MAVINIIHGDCMVAMARMKDKQYDLAICDPPYGLGTCQEYGNTRGIPKRYPKKEWDSSIPDGSYFKELRRVTKNQIIFGANYMTLHLPPSRGWVYWRKLMGGNYSDGELAWTSFDRGLKEYTQRSEQGNRFHPTQKPVALYQWLLKNYAKPGDKILDTHGGSCSIAIACDIMGFGLDCYEIDLDYWTAATERLQRHKRQEALPL